MKFFDDSGFELSVKDLNDDIIFDLPFTNVATPEATTVLVTKVEDRNNDLVMHNISYSSPTTAIEFRIVPGKPKQFYDIFIKLDEMASDTDYDDTARVKQANGFSFLWTVPPGNGTYYIAVRQSKKLIWYSFHCPVTFIVLGSVYTNIAWSFISSNKKTV